MFNATLKKDDALTLIDNELALREQGRQIALLKGQIAFLAAENATLKVKIAENAIKIQEMTSARRELSKSKWRPSITRGFIRAKMGADVFDAIGYSQPEPSSSSSVMSNRTQKTPASTP